MQMRNRPLGAALVLLLGAAASTGAWTRARAQIDVPAPAPNPPRIEAPSESEEPLSREARLDLLFEALSAGDETEAARAEMEIRRLWSRSGSDTMDLLLQRGREALEKEELTKAIHHFSALTDHAPDFAEGWNMRATAFFLRGDLGQSLADIERTLSLEPRHFGALSGLGVILEQLGREKEAMMAFREAKRVHPHLANVNEAMDRLAPRVDGRGI